LMQLYIVNSSSNSVMNNVINIEKEYSAAELKAQLFATATTLSKTTKDQNSLKISNWLSYLKVKTLKNLLDHPKESIECLEAEDSIKHTPTNHHVHISAVVSFIHHVLKDEKLEEVWKKEEKRNWQPIADRYDLNKPSELQEDKIMPAEDIEAIRIQLPQGSFPRLLLSFYTLMEPIRADYFATELVKEGEESKEENYITMGDDYKLVVRDFKTKASYTQINNTLPLELKTELDESLKKYPRSYLFVGEDKKSPYSSRKMFSNWACRTLKTALKHEMTLTALRHIYIMSKLKEDRPAEELVEIAKKMGHSRAMQRVYEWK